jgi:hypothetical protein
MSYRQADGSVTRELVPPETLADPEANLTLGRCPVTLEHPHQDVGPSNVQELGVGDVDGEICIADNGFVRVKLAARRKDAIQAIEDGVKQQLSPGYTCRVDPTPGIWNGEAYDAIQRDRRYNHLAIVGAARGGPQIRLRADSAEEVSEPLTTEAKADMDPILAAFLDSHPEFRRDGLAVKDLLDELFQAMGKAKGDLKDAMKAHDLTKGERDAYATKVADLEGKLQELLKAKVEEDPEAESVSEEIEAAKDKKADADEEQARIAYADERAPLVAKADSLKIVHANLGNAALRRVIVAAIHPAYKADSSDEYVRAYLDATGQDTRFDALSDAFRKAQEAARTDSAKPGSDWDPTGRNTGRKE